MTKAYTGVGSREAPTHILTLTRMLAFKLASEGWQCWTGKAPGMDINFYLGAMDWLATQPSDKRFKVAINYLPWDGFEGGWHNDPSGHFVNYQKLDACIRATEMAASVHPAWDRCKNSGAFHMHSRNCMQVLGPNLETPSKRLICWAKESIKGVVSGGTATAVTIARINNVPVLNMFLKDDYEKVLRYVGITEDKLMALSGVSGV